MPSNAAVPNLFGTREWFDKGRGRWSGDDSGTFIVHFVSIIVISAPPLIIRHLILEVGDPCFKGQTGPPCLWEVDSSA